MIKKIKSIPWWGWVVGFVYFGLQYGMYRLGDLISRITGTINSAWCPKIDPLDNAIPVIAVFSVIYLFSYVFWICGPIAVSLTSKRNFYNYIIGLSAAYIIGFLIFCFSPTYMDRTAEGLSEIASRDGIFYSFLGTIYSNDGSDMAFNLFPSYHCLISLYCYLGVCRQPEISKGFRAYSLVMTILICMSTVFTKQHYVLDIAGGLLISIICYNVVSKLDLGKRIVEKE